MKVTIKNHLFFGFISVACLLFFSCELEQINTGNDQAENAQYASIIKVSDDGATTFIESNLMCSMVETVELSETELGLLLYMKEEEKLARDVYTVFYEKWGSQIFSRISLAEDRHMNAVLTLLKFYGSADTLAGEPGVFTIEELQLLYNELITTGDSSLQKALMTGALIEEMDIYDLTEALNLVDNKNIVRVFENLLKASRNHLRAFAKQLDKLGLVYEPVYLTQEEYNTIVYSPLEQGNRYRMHKRVNNNGNGNIYQNNYGKGCSQPSDTCCDGTSGNQVRKRTRFNGNG